MNYEDKYRELRAIIKGRHSACKEFLDMTDDNFENYNTVREAKAQMKEFEILIDKIKNLDK